MDDVRLVRLILHKLRNALKTHLAWGSAPWEMILVGNVTVTRLWSDLGKRLCENLVILAI
jgi:hypothetical protein